MCQNTNKPPKKNSPTNLFLRNKSQVALREDNFFEILKKYFSRFYSISILKLNTNNMLSLSLLNKVFVEDSTKQLLTVDNPRETTSEQLKTLTIYHGFLTVHQLILVQTTNKKNRGFSQKFVVNVFVIANAFEFTEEERVLKVIEEKIQVFLYNSFKKCKLKNLPSEFSFVDEKGNISNEIPSFFECSNSNSGSLDKASYKSYMNQFEIHITQYGANRLHVWGAATRDCFQLPYRGSEIVIPGPTVLNTLTDLDVVNSLLSAAPGDKSPIGSYNKHLLLKLFLSLHVPYDLEALINFYNVVIRKASKMSKVSIFREASSISIPSVYYLQTAYWFVFYAVLKESHYSITNAVIKSVGGSDPKILNELPYFLVLSSLIEKYKTLETKLAEATRNYSTNKSFASSAEFYTKLSSIFRELNLYSEFLYSLALLLVKLGTLNPVFLFFTLSEGKETLLYKAEQWWPYVPVFWWENLSTWSLEPEEKGSSSKMTLAKSVWVKMQEALTNYFKLIKNFIEVFKKFELVLHEHIRLELNAQGNSATVYSFRKNSIEVQCYLQFIQLLVSDYTFLLTDAEVETLNTILDLDSDRDSVTLTSVDALLLNSKRLGEVNKSDFFAFFITKMYSVSKFNSTIFIDDNLVPYITEENVEDLRFIINRSKLSSSAIRLGGLNVRSKNPLASSEPEDGNSQKQNSKQNKISPSFDIPDGILGLEKEMGISLNEPLEELVNKFLSNGKNKSQISAYFEKQGRYLETIPENDLSAKSLNQLKKRQQFISLGREFINTKLFELAATSLFNLAQSNSFEKEIIFENNTQTVSNLENLTFYKENYVNFIKQNLPEINQKAKELEIQVK